MAFISDPRTFFSPTFRFERDGRFLQHMKLQPPSPEDLFVCKIGENNEIPSLLKKVDGSVFSILCGKDEHPMFFVVSHKARFPIFWRMELFDQNGRECDEAAYKDFWKVKRVSELAYVSLHDEGASLKVQIEGCFIEIILYLFYFEAEEPEVERITALLEGQALQDVMSEKWNELTSMVTVNLKVSSLNIVTHRDSFRKQLLQKYTVVTNIAKLLTTK